MKVGVEHVVVGKGVLLDQIERIRSREAGQRVINLTKEVRDLTSTIRWLTWAAVGIAGVALAVSISALVRA